MTIDLVLCLIGGSILGLIFFLGLWWTIHKAITSTNPAVWFLSSALVRITIVLTGFYWMMAGDWQRLVAALLGFILMKLVVTRLTPLLDQHCGEKRHAS